MASVTELDASGQRLSPCTLEKAQRLLAEGKAQLVTESPFVIQLPYAAPPIPTPTVSATPRPGKGKQLLLHVCCGPCSTYTLQRLREQGFGVSGLWYNPNVHPFSEHERRRTCVQEYADSVGLHMFWQPYEMPAYFRSVVGHESFEERCGFCYHMRLERTAQVARERGLDAFTSTLLISPYQQQTTIRDIGDDLASQYGVQFYFENFRQGWNQRGKLAAAHEMYQQRYCGCVYSEWEARDRSASTRGPRKRA